MRSRTEDQLDRIYRFTGTDEAPAGPAQGQARLTVYHRPRRSGRVPAEPYPPDRQREDTRSEGPGPAGRLRGSTGVTTRRLALW